VRQRIAKYGNASQRERIHKADNDDDDDNVYE